MTPIEILHAIVDADAKARSVKEEAAKLRDHFGEYVSDNIENIRNEQYLIADKEISEAEAAETRRADETIEKLNQKLKNELDEAQKSFEQEKDAVVSKIFKMAVDLDA